MAGVSSEKWKQGGYGQTFSERLSLCLSLYQRKQECLGTKQSQFWLNMTAGVFFNKSSLWMSSIVCVRAPTDFQIYQELDIL